METRTWYYYFRDRHRKPICTVCLILWPNGLFTRGVAIVHDNDNPCKKVGRNIAHGYAVAARVSEKHTRPILTNAAVGKCDFDFRSEFNPELTTHEYRMVTPPDQEEAA